MASRAIRTVAQSLIAVAAIAATTLFAPSASAGLDPPDPPAPSNPGVVRVDSGWLRGSVADDHVTYSGIPYAAPPVGERRWQPPARQRPWSGVRDATTPSTPCPQYGMEGAIGAEDCLYLDVKVPRSARPGSRLPVLVWLHGGGFNSGAAGEYDGTEIATTGDLVVVTINYRLGALGFLAAPALGAEPNFGLLDQTSALRWVRRNAARFGGDPRNVTLAGQSAGARSVCAHLAAPMSRGLFHRAISQSGACDNSVPTLAAAREFGARATAELGCASAADVTACLRERRPARLLETLQGVGFQVHGRVRERPWNPVAGTRMLPQQPGAALRNGSAARVPLLIGGTHDEMRSFVAGQAELTTGEYDTMMTEAFGEEAATVLAEYPAADYDSPALALASVLSDWGGAIGACPVLRTAEAAADHQPVYAYEFAEDSGQAADGFPGYHLGAYHGLELPYLWKLDDPWNAYPELTTEQERLSETMIDYWSAFAHAGDPNGAGRPQWPEFGSTGTVIGLSTAGIEPTPYAADHRCGFWADLRR